MTIETLSGPSTEETVGMSIAHLVGGDEALGSEFEQLSEGAKIKAEIEALWRIYEGRRLGRRYDVGGPIEERLLVTRYPDEQGIEEVYELVDDYSGRVKLGLSQTARVLIDTPETQIKIEVDENDMITVSQKDASTNDWLTVEGDVAKAQVDEFFHRSVVAAQKHSDRSPAERARVDEHARQLALERFPEYAVTTAATE